MMATKSTLSFSTAVVPVEPWKSTEEALNHLRGNFRYWLLTVGDMLDRGLHVEPDILGDLAEIADALAQFIGKPHSIEVRVDHVPASVLVPEIHRMVKDCERENLDGARALLFDALSQAIEAHRAERDCPDPWAAEEASA